MGPRHALRMTGLLAVACALGLVLVACAAPQVQLKRADLAKVTTTGFRVNMDLSIFNPNAYTFPLKSVGWNLNLFRAPFTHGTVGTNNQIAANRTTPVRVPLGIRFSSARAGVQKFLSGQNIPWGIGGKCTFSTPAGPVFVQFAKDGTWKNPIKGKLRLGASSAQDDERGPQIASSLQLPLMP